MATFERNGLRAWMPVVLVVSSWMPGGCRLLHRDGAAPAKEPVVRPMTIAVAPALNQSGSADFDPDRFGDLMASELSHADAISVIPVSRVLAALATHGAKTVRSPAQALELAGQLGADAVLVFAVTEYDPYDPPIIGLTCQLYGTRVGRGGRTLDAVAFSRRAALASNPGRSATRGLLAQTQHVFNASHDAVAGDIRKFAQTRGMDASPYGWRKHVVSQQHFIRYCCHAAIGDLLRFQEKLILADENRER